MPGEIYMGTMRVIEGGALTTIQDLGRMGYQSYGVPQSGALDFYSFSLGNSVLGNPLNTPGLECTVVGPVLEFLSDEVICITGADLGATIDGQPCPMWQTVRVNKGSVLSFQGLKWGCRAYLCIRGGIVCPSVLGSASTFVKASLGGFQGRALKAGDLLLLGGFDEFRELAVPEELRINPVGETEVRVVVGPQEHLFDLPVVDLFLHSKYRVGLQADRMGYRLEGPAVLTDNTLSAFSQGMPLGGIQIDGRGSPTVLLRDRQTVGGYPVIATVIQADVDLFAQLKPGDQILFTPIAMSRATELYRERLNTLRGFREISKALWNDVR